MSVFILFVFLAGIAVGRLLSSERPKRLVERRCELCGHVEGPWRPSLVIDSLWYCEDRLACVDRYWGRALTNHGERGR